MEQPNLAMIPSGVKATKVYSIMPESGVGDFTFARSSTAYRINKNGLWETSASNLPRLHYDLTNGNPDSCPCLLLEPASTNILGYSETFSSWGQTRSDITLNSLTSPDGTVNASKMTDDGSTGTDTSQRFLSVTVEEDEDYHFSVFAKKGSMDFIALRTGSFSDGGGTGETFFNLATGAVGTTYANHTASIEKYPNEWYRCIIKFTSGTDLNGTLLIRQASSNGTSTVPLDGNSFIYLWGAQFEKSTFVTSYIKSDSNSQTTRSAETCNGAGDANTFNSEQGILFAELAAFSDTVESGRISLSKNNSNNDYISFDYRATSNTFRIVYNVGGSNIIATSHNISSPSNAFNKVAFKFKAGSQELYVNGNLITTSLSSSVYSSGTLSQIQFSLPSGGSVFKGKCKDLRYYDTEGMTDTEITNLLTQLTK
tara:strand:- start:10544 stop:11821 length:1278 start_codon:yes stop_codon:yes gene_type:complete